MRYVRVRVKSVVLEMEKAMLWTLSYLTFGPLSAFICSTMSELQEREQYGIRLLSLGTSGGPDRHGAQYPHFTPSDGGGIRGLSELLILREIMERIQFQQGFKELPLPCDYFDIIGGTSTGGLVFAAIDVRSPCSLGPICSLGS